MISKGFLKSSIVYTIGGAMPMAASIILLPFYTNYLNEIHFLQVSFYISISLLFQILFSFSTDTYFGVKYSQLDQNPEKQKLFVGTNAILLLVIGLGWLIITAFTGKPILDFVFKPEYGMEFWPYGFYAILTAFFNSYFKTSTNCLIYFKKPLLFLSLNLVNFIATLAISIGGLFMFPDSIVGPMYGRLLSGLVIFLLANGVFFTFGKFKFEKEFLPDLFKFCTPYLFYVLSAWVLSFIDRFMLQKHISETDLNTYDLILKCFFGIEFLQNSLSAVIFPKLYEIWGKQTHLHTTKESNRYFNVFTAINIFQLIVFCIAIPIVYQLFITKKSFYDAAKYIGVLAAGFGLRSILNFYLSTILFSKNIKVLLKIFASSAVFQIIVTYYAASTFGLIGVIYGGLLTKLVQVILSYLFTRGIFNYTFNYFKIIVVPLIYLVINLIHYHFFPVYDIKLYMLQLVLFSILFFFLFKNEIKQVLLQFKVIR